MKASGRRLPGDALKLLADDDFGRPLVDQIKHKRTISRVTKKK